MGIFSKIASFLYGMGASNVNTAPKVAIDYGYVCQEPKQYGQMLQQQGRQRWVKRKK